MNFLVLQLHSGEPRFSLGHSKTHDQGRYGLRVRFGLSVLRFFIASTLILQCRPDASLWAQDHTDYDRAIRQTLNELQQIFAPTDFPADLQIRLLDSEVIQYEAPTISIGRFVEKKSSPGFWRFWRAALTHELGHAIFQKRLGSLRAECLLRQREVKPWADSVIDVCKLISRPYEELFADFLVVYFSNDVSLVSQTFDYFWGNGPSSLQTVYRDFSPERALPVAELNDEELSVSFGDPILDQVLQWPESHIHLAKSRKSLGQDLKLRQSPLVLLRAIALELNQHTQVLPELPNPLKMNERLMYSVQQINNKNN